MAITRKRALRIGLYGTLSLILLGVLLHPYSRQMLFGPRLDGVPLAYWQDQFRACADPNSPSRASFTAKIIWWLGMDRHDHGRNLPSNESDLLQLLLSLEQDTQPYVRKAVAGELGHHNFAPDECVPPLLRLLDDAEPSVRAAAAEALADTRPESPEAMRRLLELLDEEDIHCRLEVARAVWRIGRGKHREVISVLRQALKHSDRDVRFVAACYLVFDLQKICADAFPDLAECALSDSDSKVRSVAIRGLQFCGRPAVSVLIKALRDLEPDPRRAAIDTLGRIGSDAKEAVPLLEQLLRDPSLDVREVAMEALGKIDPERFPPQKKPDD